MAKEILKRCVIVCASPDADYRFIQRVLKTDDYIIAADGGMETLNRAEVKPDLFVGDFDSYGGIVPDGVEVIKLNVRKDDTDSMHCASVAVERGFKEVLLLGAMGGAASHTFSNYSVLSYLSDCGVSASMRDQNETVMIINNSVKSFNNLSGHEFSVFPFGCESVTVTYIGDVDYPAENLVLSESSSLGKSNVFRGDSARIEVKNGKALVFIAESITKL